jgi:hypothetical protein
MIKLAENRVIVFEGCGFGRTTALKMHQHESFGFEIWRHIESARQKAFVAFVLVKDMDTVEWIIAEIDRIAGGLEKPGTGIVCVLNVLDPGSQ